MATAQDIITEARYTLSDPNAKAWSDPRLLSLVNAGLRKVAEYTQYYRDTLFIDLQDEISVYDLSPVVYKITRVEYNGEPLKFMTHDQMDKQDWDWQEADGDPEVVVFDQFIQGKFKVYPYLTSTLGDVSRTSPYGIITGVINVDYVELVESGAISTELVSVKSLKVYYVKRLIVSALTDTTGLPEDLEEAVAHYVAGRAFLDNQDTRNLERGKTELILFEDMVKQYKQNLNVNSVTGSAHYTEYGGAL